MADLPIGKSYFSKYCLTYFGEHGKEQKKVSFILEMKKENFETKPSQKQNEAFSKNIISLVNSGDFNQKLMMNYELKIGNSRYDYYACVGLNNLIDGSSSLLPANHYKDPSLKNLTDALETRQLRTLGDLCHIIRPDMIKENVNGAFKVGEIMLADISEVGSINSIGKILTLSEEQYFRALKHRVEPGDLLFSFKGTIGKVGFVDSRINDLKIGLNDIFVSQALLIMRPTRIDQGVLFEYLSSSKIRQYMNATASGNSIKNLSTKVMKSMPVLEPEETALKDIENTFLDKKSIGEDIRRLQMQLRELKENSWPDNSL